MGKESKIIIGIVAKHREEDKDLIRQDSRIRDEVKQAVFDNGGTAIGILSPNEKVQMAGDDWLIYEKFLDKENIIKQIELCDGIILQGGNTNESFEPYIARYCYENDIPAEKKIQSKSARIQSPHEHQGRTQGSGGKKIKRKKAAFSLNHKDRIFMWSFLLYSFRTGSYDLYRIT